MTATELMPEYHTARVENDLVLNVRRLLLTVTGKPVPQRRSIFVKKLARGVNPNNRDQKRVQRDIREQMQSIKECTPFLADDQIIVKIRITFRLRRPNSHFTNKDRSKSVREEMKRARHTNGDIDNLIKFILDAGNTLFYKDDRQVSQLNASVLWHEDPSSPGSTTISVEEALAW